MKVIGTIKKKKGRAFIFKKALSKSGNSVLDSGTYKNFEEEGEQIVLEQYRTGSYMSNRNHRVHADRVLLDASPVVEVKFEFIGIDSTYSGSSVMALKDVETEEVLSVYVSNSKTLVKAMNRLFFSEPEDYLKIEMKNGKKYLKGIFELIPMSRNQFKYRLLDSEKHELSRIKLI